MNRLERILFGTLMAALLVVGGFVVVGALAGCVSVHHPDGSRDTSLAGIPVSHEDPEGNVTPVGPTGILAEQGGVTGAVTAGALALYSIYRKVQRAKEEAEIHKVTDAKIAAYDKGIPTEKVVKPMAPPAVTPIVPVPPA